MTIVMNIDPALKTISAQKNPLFGSSVVGSCQVHKVFQNMAHDLFFYKRLEKGFPISSCQVDSKTVLASCLVHYLSSTMPVDWPDSLEID